MFGIAEAVSSVSNMIDGIVDKIWPDATETEKARAKMALAELNNEYSARLRQLDINIQEAKHPSMFVAGWRPALGWLCVVSLGYVWIGRDLLMVVLAIAGEDMAARTLPLFNTGELMTLITGILGLGATRAYEKKNGVARDRLK